ncbi:DUF7147 family protein [Salinicoccus halodurans]|uniref:DUF7147 domain-containing protein n=1 Tax=Salinicoccus halodurans TaxID=407035 RepID=A0A0F7HKN4_9STAP|nr:hypothetical protein [Salinicoccus halodurans]AKG73692.1 hypothetical protein AAT16_05350 [Salinicoccus halodurans]SFK54388.1 hypothetical protein SAMN05216235_0310 [Salinicoccus halodurans]
MQKFITLGEGYGDIFELESLISHNHTRIDKAIFLHTGDSHSTFLLVMQPVRGNFQAIYTIYNGIRYNQGQGQKYTLIRGWCEGKNIPVIEFSARDPEDFYEREQFYQYITGVLRLNHLIPPM